jgi:hypothetical protein
MMFVFNTRVVGSCARFWLGSPQEGDLQGAVSKTTSGLSSLTEGLKEKAKVFEETLKEVSPTLLD